MKSLLKTGLLTLGLLGGSMSVSAAQIDFTDGAYSGLNGQQSTTIGDITFSAYRYFLDITGNIQTGSLVTGDPALVQLSQNSFGIGVDTIPTGLIENIAEPLFDDDDKVDGWEFVVLSFAQPVTVNGIFLNDYSLLESGTAYLFDDGFPELELGLNTDLLSLDSLLDALTPDALNWDGSYWDFDGEDNVSHIVISAALLSDFYIAGIDYTIGNGGPGDPNPVPEPASLLLLTTGLGMLGWRQRRKAISQQEPLMA